MVTIAKLVEKSKDVTLTKNTANDRVGLLRDAIEDAFYVQDRKVYSYYLDHDDTYIYFECYDWDFARYFKWRVGYSVSGTQVELEDECVAVTRYTDWVVDGEESVEKTLFSKLTSLLDKAIKPAESVPLIKQLNDEQMVAIEYLYVPAGVVDEHGDVVASDAVTEGMVESLNKAIDNGTLQMGLFHKHNTDGCHIQNAWVNPVDCQIGEDFVKAGVPLVEVKFTKEALWEEKKNGKILGLSIGAKATVENIA